MGPSTAGAWDYKKSYRSNKGITITVQSTAGAWDYKKIKRKSDKEDI